MSALDTNSIPAKVTLNDREYTLEILRKESPDEFVSFSKSVIKMGNLQQLVGFLTMFFLPYLGFSTILFWGDYVKLIASYALIASILIIECGAYHWKCQYSQDRVAKLFPHIKVSDSDGVITTMTPKAYIGQIQLTSTLDYPLPILPLLVSHVGHRHAFSIDRFKIALDSAIKAREDRTHRS